MKMIDLVKDQTAHFKFYRDNNLWYSIPVVGEPGTAFEFPVPISDIGNATFLRDDKAIYFMRYIKKHLKWIDEAKVETLNEN